MGLLRPYMQLESQIRGIIGQVRHTVAGTEVASDVEAKLSRGLRGRAEFILNEFLRLGRRLPAAVNEELWYRLLIDLGDMPPDLARRYTADIAERYNLNPSDRQRLIRLIERIVTLKPSERRVVLDQVRRAQFS